MITKTKTTLHSLPYVLYLDWIAANALAEAIGIGAAAFIAVMVGVGGVATLHPLLVLVLVVLGGALIEGTLVGLLQGLALGRWVDVRRWTLYTTLGVAVAWTIGMLPSTIIDLTMTASASPLDASSTAPIELSPTVTLLLAFGMGLVLGPFIGVPQWRILRKTGMPAAWRWIPANMLAWGVGMTLIFASMDFMPTALTAWETGLWGALVGAVTGGVVGLLHGWLLIELTAHSPLLIR
ncbi:MAG: hypothetical protein AAF125_01565 [Chloroflexota bacterium]